MRSASNSYACQNPAPRSEVSKQGMAAWATENSKKEPRRAVNRQTNQDSEVAMQMILFLAGWILSWREVLCRLLLGSLSLLSWLQSKYDTWRFHPSVLWSHCARLSFAKHPSSWLGAAEERLLRAHNVTVHLVQLLFAG